MIYTSTRSVLLFPRRGGGGFLLHFRQESARGYVLFSRFIIARSEPYLFRGKKRNCDSTREKIQLIHSDISTVLNPSMCSILFEHEKEMDRSKIVEIVE